MEITSIQKERKINDSEVSDLFQMGFSGLIKKKHQQFHPSLKFFFTVGLGNRPKDDKKFLMLQKSHVFIYKKKSKNVSMK